jgi:hypothetical protein
MLSRDPRHRGKSAGWLVPGAKCPVYSPVIKNLRKNIWTKWEKSESLKNMNH